MESILVSDDDGMNSISKYIQYYFCPTYTKSMSFRASKVDE